MVWYLVGIQLKYIENLFGYHFISIFFFTILKIYLILIGRKMFKIYWKHNSSHFLISYIFKIYLILTVISCTW